MTTVTDKTLNKTSTEQDALTHIWYHNSRKRVYDVPAEKRWELQWEQVAIVKETSRSYVLSNGVKVPKNAAKRDPMEFALTDTEHQEAVWNHDNHLRVTSGLQAMARNNPQLTRELAAILAKYK